MIKKAIIPAAGFGKRFLPVTKSQTKTMFPIIDKPALHYIIEEIIDAGIFDITIIIGCNSYSIEKYFENIDGKDLFNNKKLKINFIKQEEALGLGHAILQAKEYIGNEFFFVALGDLILKNEYGVTKQMLDIYMKHKESTIIGVNNVLKEEVQKFGIVHPTIMIEERLFIIKNFLEKPNSEIAPSTLGCFGRYILSPKIFEYIEETKLDINGEIQLTDGILKSIRNNEKVLAYKFLGKSYDIGSKLGFLIANIEYGLSHEEVKNELFKYLAAY